MLTRRGSKPFEFLCCPREGLGVRAGLRLQGCPLQTHLLQGRTLYQILLRAG